MWVNRRGLKGPGASGGPEGAAPIPKLEVPSLAALAERLGVVVG